MKQQPDTYKRIIKLLKKLNQKHPLDFGLIRIYIYDDGSGGFMGRVKGDYSDYEFINLKQLKMLFKEFGV